MLEVCCWMWETQAFFYNLRAIKWQFSVMYLRQHCCFSRWSAIGHVYEALNISHYLTYWQMGVLKTHSRRFWLYGVVGGVECWMIKTHSVQVQCWCGTIQSASKPIKRTKIRPATFSLSPKYPRTILSWWLGLFVELQQRPPPSPNLLDKAFF